MQQKAKYHHGDLKRALIDKAVELIAARGTDTLTLKEVAHALGVTHTAPYRHFADKRALLVAVAEAGFEKLTLRMERAHTRAASEARRQFLDTGFAVIEFALASPGHYRAMFYGSKGSTLDELAQARESSAFHRLLSYIAAWQSAGLLRTAPPLSLALAIFATTHGLASLISTDQIHLKSKRAVRELADSVHGLLLDGVGA